MVKESFLWLVRLVHESRISIIILTCVFFPFSFVHTSPGFYLGFVAWGEVPHAVVKGHEFSRGSKMK